MISVQRSVTILLLIMLSLIYGCSHELSIDEAHLQQQLSIDAPKLLPIAQLLDNAPPGAIIDRRFDEWRVEPSSLQSQVNDTMRAAMINANIQFATHDQAFGGILFEIDSAGIGVSGNSIGYLYSSQTELSNNNTTQVNSLNKGLASALAQHQGETKLVQPITSHWSLYLETF